jgi:hypothetical protein
MVTHSPATARGLKILVPGAVVSSLPTYRMGQIELNSPTTESQPRLDRSLQSNRGVMGLYLAFHTAVRDCPERRNFQLADYIALRPSYVVF